MKIWGAILLLGTALACSSGDDNQSQKNNNPEAGNKYETKVVYGEDNRKDPFDEPSMELRVLAQSTVALVQSSRLSESDDGTVSMRLNSYGAGRRLCTDEPFYEQSTGAFCSGFLVAPDVVVTAGHCIRSARDCSETKFVFDFAVSALGAEVPSLFSADQVYSCSEIIKQELERSNMQDYAVVRLDRPAIGRAPLSVRREGQPELGQRLAVIGHPAGLPTKIADGGTVLKDEGTFFIADLDTYGGNSGSAVFNRDTFEVEGILVRGATDYVRDPVNSCTRSNECAAGEISGGCRGEDVTRITGLTEHIPE